MKKTILLLLISYVCHSSVFASHGLGGEITWSCQGSNYVFELKFYRDCNGITGPASLVLTTNVPGVPTIPMFQFSVTDISPTGDNNSGIVNCPVCPISGSGGGPGAVHEYVYRSAPTLLPGTPPATGWVFSWGECCRSSNITNLTGSAGLSMGLRAVMYPFTGFVANQCTDNSPYFAERPSIITCTRYPVEYNHQAVDVEFDSLEYAWDYPVSSPPISIQPFASGYSATSPLPGPTQHPSNVPAVLNSFTGAIQFTSFTHGNFITVLKVSSFRCGELTAEIFREMHIMLIDSCAIPVSGIVFNQPPVIPAPIQDSAGNWNYHTTVVAGDSIDFPVFGYDTDPHPINTAQDVTLSASGLLLAPGSNPWTNCLIPPCATLSANPVTGLVLVNSHFGWQTTSDHLGLSFNCVQLSNIHTFLFRAIDNYCPAPSFTYKTITITVIPFMAPPPVNFVSGQLECPLSGPYRFQWFRDRWAIAGADASVYTPTQPGYYQVLVMDTLTHDGNYSNVYSYLVSVPTYLNSTFVDVYPNPSTDGSFTLFINGINLSNARYTLSDFAGRIIYSENFASIQSPFSRNLNLNYSKGVYLLKVESDEGIAIKKLVIN